MIVPVFADVVRVVFEMIRKSFVPSDSHMPARAFAVAPAVYEEALTTLPVLLKVPDPVVTSAVALENPVIEIERPLIA